MRRVFQDTSGWLKSPSRSIEVGYHGTKEGFEGEYKHNHKNGEVSFLFELQEVPSFDYR